MEGVRGSSVGARREGACLKRDDEARGDGVDERARHQPEATRHEQ